MTACMLCSSRSGGDGADDRPGGDRVVEGGIKYARAAAVLDVGAGPHGGDLAVGGRVPAGATRREHRTRETVLQLGVERVVDVAAHLDGVAGADDVLGCLADVAGLVLEH